MCVYVVLSNNIRYPDDLASTPAVLVASMKCSLCDPYFQVPVLQRTSFSWEAGMAVIAKFLRQPEALQPKGTLEFIQRLCFDCHAGWHLRGTASQGAVRK